MAVAAGGAVGCGVAVGMVWPPEPDPLLVVAVGKISGVCGATVSTGWAVHVGDACPSVGALSAGRVKKSVRNTVSSATLSSSSARWRAVTDRRVVVGGVVGMATANLRHMNTHANKYGRGDFRQYAECRCVRQAAGRFRSPKGCHELRHSDADERHRAVRGDLDDIERAVGILAV